MTKQEVISQVQSSLGSMFTKDDVINCLNMVVEEPKVETKGSYPSKEWLDKIKNSILERVKDVDFNDSDMFEISEMEFDIKYGNQIEIDSYEVDACSLKTYVENEIEETFDSIEDDIIEIQQGNEEEESEAFLISDGKYLHRKKEAMKD
jgi:hypothetical protein